MRREALSATMTLIIPVVLMSLCGCSGEAPPAVSEGVVAVFDGGVVTEDEVEQAMRTSRGPGRGEDLTVAERREREIRHLVWRRVLTAKWGDEIRQSDEWERAEESARRGIWVDALGAQVAEKIEVPEEMIEQQVERRRQDAATRESLRVRHIYLRADETMTAAERAAQRRLAEELLQRARAGESFEQLAREYSQSETAAKGGMINALNRGATNPAFEKVAFSLDKGEIGDIVDTPHGFHIVKLEERFSPRNFNEEEARRVSAEQLNKHFHDREMHRLMASLRQSEQYEARWDANGNLDPRPSDNAVMIVGDTTVLTQADVEAMVENRPAMTVGTAALAGALEEILGDQLLYLEARRTLVDKEQQLEAAVARALDSRLEAMAIGRETKQLKGSVTREQLEEFASQYSGHLMVPGEVRPQLIFLPYDEEDPYQTFLKAEQLVARIRAGEGFAEIAREHSRGPNADKGGDLGMMSRRSLGYIGLDVAQAVTHLGVGEVSDPIRIPTRRLGVTVAVVGGGFAIVRLAEQSEPRQLQLDTDEALVRDRYWEFYHEDMLNENIEQTLDEAGFRLVEGP